MRAKPRKKSFVVGTGGSEISTSLSAAVPKCSWLFVSRLNENTASEDIKKHLGGLCGLTTAETEVEELKTKYPGYKSFKIKVPQDKKDVVLDSKVWPKGVFVDRFVFPKGTKHSLTRDRPTKDGSSNFLEDRVLTQQTS